MRVDRAAPKKLSVLLNKLPFTTTESIVELFRTSFTSDLDMISQHRQFVKTHHPNLDPRLFYSCVVMRMLYDMAIDGYERHGSTGTGNTSAAAGIANNT